MSLFGRIFLSTLGISLLPAIAGVLTRRIDVILVSTAVSLFFAYIFARYITRSVDALSGAAQQITEETEQRGQVLSDIKSQFVLVTAHQMRTPLSAMKWTLRLMLDGDMGELTEKQREFLQRGYETNDHMIRLVNDFLTISRIEEGRFGFHFKKSKIIDTLQKAVQDSQAQARLAGISLEFQPTTVADLVVVADEERIYSVMMNMLDNAIRYSSSGDTVRVDALQKDKLLEIRITDTGIGIPIEEQQKIFSRFYRASNALRHQTEGSGLGLYIARNIIQHHGGDIRFQSEEGKGTTVFFTLPIQE